MADAAVEECGGSPPSGTRRRGLTQHGQTFKRGTRPQTAAGCSASLRGRLARRARPGASACPCPRCMRAARPSTSTAIELGQHRHDCQHAGPPRAAFFSAGMAGAWWAMRDSEENWPCGMGHGSVVLERWPVVDNMAFGSAPGGPYRLAGRKHRSSDGQTIGLASPFERAHMFSMAFRSATIVLRTTPQQAQVLWRHAGARRFAYNACVANIHALLARKDDPERGPLPWSPFDNISYFYRFKKSAAAGVAEDGTPGLPWRREVHQRVFDEGAKDCGRAMARWGAYCKARKQAKEAGRKPRRKVGPPQFSRRHGGRATFRILTDAKHTYITVLREGLRLPCFGVLAIGQSTRTLRRMLRAHKDPKRTAYITQVTFHFDHAKARWKATLAITWTPSQPVAPLSSKSLGCDVGLRRLVTVADEDGGNLAFHLQPAEIAKNYVRMRKAQRQLGLKRLTSDRKKEAEGADRRTVSKSEVRAQRKLQRRHVRIKNVRQAHMHALTNRLVQTHGRFGLEGLHIQGMLRNHRVAGKIARQAWREFREQIQYKAAWK